MSSKSRICGFFPARGGEYPAVAPSLRPQSGEGPQMAAALSERGRSGFARAFPATCAQSEANRPGAGSSGHAGGGRTSCLGRPQAQGQSGEEGTFPASGQHGACHPATARSAPARGAGTCPARIWTAHSGAQGGRQRTNLFPEPEPESRQGFHPGVDGHPGRGRGWNPFAGVVQHKNRIHRHETAFGVC